jgi:hypothetical protein
MGIGDSVYYINQINAARYGYNMSLDIAFGAHYIGTIIPVTSLKSNGLIEDAKIHNMCA